MVERDEQRAGIARGRVLGILDDSASTRASRPEARANAESALTVATNFGPLADADLVIEAVFEDMDVKKAVFAELDAVARPTRSSPPTPPISTSTRSPRRTSDPSRVVGLHFFSPAHVMKLLEIVTRRRRAGRAGHRSRAGQAAAQDHRPRRRLRRLHRQPHHVGLPARGDLHARGRRAPAGDRRRHARFRLPMGIFQMADLAGLDIGWAMRKRQAATRDPSERYVEIADRICELGRFGRKTGRGWYD
jgi:3-hydroxyacyl-CoA dehydrogenase